MVDLFCLNLSCWPKCPSVHHHIDSFDVLSFAYDCKFSQSIDNFIMSNYSIVLFGLIYNVVPFEEKLFVSLVDIRKIAYTHSFEFSFQICHLIITVFIFTIGAYFSEDIRRVKVLPAFFLIFFHEPSKQIFEKIFHFFLIIVAIKVLVWIQGIFVWCRNRLLFVIKDGHYILTEFICVDSDCILSSEGCTLWMI